jgi:hypothetical protein
MTGAASTTRQAENFVLSAQILDTPRQSKMLIDVPASFSPIALISKGFQNFGYLSLWIQG